MASTWQSITAATGKPIYGFHDAEEGFVWSSHAFGLFFPNVVRVPGVIVLAVHNPRGEITPECRLGDQLADGLPDAVNIACCREHVHGIRFEHRSIEPPLPLEDDSVDIPFAHSVLTPLSP